MGLAYRGQYSNPQMVELELDRLEARTSLAVATLTRQIEALTSRVDALTVQPVFATGESYTVDDLIVVLQGLGLLTQA